MDAGAKSRFEKAADVLEVDPATREIMWRRIADLQLSPDDPAVLFLAVAGILEKAATDIPEAVLSIPGKVRGRRWRRSPGDGSGYRRRSIKSRGRDRKDR
jgi:hypothetical protein